ncbi:hypothetical protein Ae201684P_016859 [Aphanomyces euteiches]|uniref:Uncharacterized protein n=1 Tax=Aphanomyces euteiches TaxID=100861 RepID=A0A6G0XHP8_9STRA|nr:hypothetical protein Ae201684_004600 [Aphanomyces euteiches]KAH9094247.1 hypothetical protein Ae201684P_016859 [Aphanomyces euteiches]KAH9143854.1 hypothetical protein AeRB84_012176 [Aphanomyces euteiches]
MHVSGEMMETKEVVDEENQEELDRFQMTPTINNASPIKNQAVSTPDPAIASDLQTITRRNTIQSLWQHITGNRKNSTVKPRSHYRRGTIFLQHLEMQKVAKGDSRFDHKFFDRVKEQYENAHLSTSTMIGLSIFQNGVNPVNDPFIVDNMPIEIQIGFRRKLFRLFSMQLLSLVGLIAIFSTSSALRSAFGSFWHLVGIFALTIVLLFWLFIKKYNYPANFVILTLYTISTSIFLVGVDAFLSTHVTIFIFGFTFVVMTQLGFYCTLSYKRSDGTPALFGYLKCVTVAFILTLGVSCAIYFTLLTDIIGLTAFLLSCGAILFLSFWFAYDASCMNQRLSPDEYMQGMIFFYTDMVVFIIFVGMIAFAFMACEGDICCCGSAEILPIYPLRGLNDTTVQPIEGDVEQENCGASAVANRDMVR